MDDKDNKNPEKEKIPSGKYRGFKEFAKVSNVIYSFITTMILGVVCGYFFDKWFTGDKWMLICILVFSFIATVNFYRGILKIK